MRQWLPEEPLYNWMNSIGSRLFSEEDQRWFAAASGDCNPMHLDALSARRTQAGAPVVHGMHSLLWLLDCLAAQHPDLPAIATVKVQLKKMILVGDEVEAVVTRKDISSLRAEVQSDGEAVLRAILTFGTAGPAPIFPVEEKPMPMPPAPLDPAWEEMEGRAGLLEFSLGSAELSSRFPHLTRLWGSSRVAAVGCTSSLVGMVVPGLHSIYASLLFHLGEEVDSESGLRFKIRSTDSRFRLIHEDFSGGGIFGSLECYYRHPPTGQAPINTVAQQVAPGSFSGATAMVVGGSRGLGELTAKILAAGGAKVILTYAYGKADAERVHAEITTWGGECTIAAYDVRGDAEEQLSAMAQAPTHFYYFATPHIFSQKSRFYSKARFDEFNTFYVDGFARLIRAGLHRRPEGIRAFYPSSIAVEDRPEGMTAYTMSKAAGEILCADLNTYLPNTRVIVARLPRLLTDQTATLQYVKSGDSLAILLPLVQKMQASDAS